MNAAAATDTTAESWWRRWIVKPLIQQLTNGNSPDKLAWSIAAGVTLGIFPIMGGTSVICALIAWAVGLNQPVTHLFKSAMYPFHLALILIFIRMGQRIFGAPLLSLSIPELLGRFKADPMRFAADFGLAAGQGVVAWMIVAPVLAILIKLAATPLLRRLAGKLRERREVLP